MNVKPNYGIAFTGLWKPKPGPYTLESHGQEEKNEHKFVQNHY